MNLSVVYSSDDHYAQHVGVSLVSLFINNLEIKNINIYLIEKNISLENKNKLEWLVNKYNGKIHFIKFDDFSNKLILDIGNSISINAYARLFLCSALPESIDKVIYFDCDSIINESLVDLWNTDITDYYVAGVCDTVSDNTKIKINMDVNSSYINSGMLLINLKKWREDNIEKRFLEFIDSYNGQVFHHDQGTINGVLKNKSLILHPKYNAMTPFFTMRRDEIMVYYGLRNYYSLTEFHEAIKKPVFIHFTPAFVNRPWIKGCKHPLTSLYQKYLEKTPWKSTNLMKDNRKKREKFVAFLYTYLPFRMANKIARLIFT